MKKLTQAVFDLPECPYWATSATVDVHGVAKWHSVAKNLLVDNQESGLWENEHINGAWSKTIGSGFDVVDWQQSAIDRGEK